MVLAIIQAYKAHAYTAAVPESYSIRAKGIFDDLIQEDS